MPDGRLGRLPVLVAGSALLLVLAGCTGAGRATPAAPSTPAATATSAATARSGSAASTPATAATTTAATPSTSGSGRSVLTSSNAAPPSLPRPGPATDAPVIVIDPGHSVTVHATDPASGLDVSDYENEPEMRDVFAVAQLVRSQLERAGYRVIMTKSSLDAPTSLAQRAAVANAAHAALALSIHDQAGGNGGIGFRAGNNIVYYQSVGNYRQTPSGKKVVFTDAAVAALSKRYATTFQRERAAAQGVPISLLGNTGYDLGTRGLPAGDIWIVQLLSHVPWIYNEAGGNSAGQLGLSVADEQRYATGLVAAVEACVPVTR